MDAVQKPLALGFAGTPQFAVPALDALNASGHRLIAVFTQPERPSGRGQSLQAGPVTRRARELGIPVHQPASLKPPESLALLSSLRLDALVVVAYGLILPVAALAVPTVGCFNIHASLLPRWRGAAPIQRALLAGDASTGITIMRMEAGLDTGPMLAQRSLEIHASDTASSLHDRLALLGAQLIVETLDELVRGVASLRSQPSDGVSYAKKLEKSEASIDWNEDAQLIVRRIRAFNPWPVAQTELEGAQLRIWEAVVAPLGDVPPTTKSAFAAGGPANVAPPGTVLAATPAGIDVQCGSGAVRILRLQLAGRKALTAGEFLKAQRLTGARLAAA